MGLVVVDGFRSILLFSCFFFLFLILACLFLLYYYCFINIVFPYFVCSCYLLYKNVFSTAFPTIIMMNYNINKTCLPLFFSPSFFLLFPSLSMSPSSLLVSLSLGLQRARVTATRVVESRRTSYIQWRKKNLPYYLTRRRKTWTMVPSMMTIDHPPIHPSQPPTSNVHGSSFPYTLSQITPLCRRC